MYPKDSATRNSISRKRKLYGNRFTKNVKEDPNAKKITSSSAESVIVNVLHTYRIIEYLTVFGALSDILICANCKQEVKFAECGQRCLGFKIVVSCSCGRREINSGPTLNTGYEINRRIVFVFRLLGIGRQGINIFCGLMDFCKGLSNTTYNRVVQHIHNAAQAAFERTTKEAVQQERKKNVENGIHETHLKVSGDGSWKKRGFTSLYGVTTLIGHYTGKLSIWW